MRIPRLFHPESLTLTQTVTLTESATRHVGLVLRLAPNDKVVLFTGDGHDYLASIVTVTKKVIQATIVDKKIAANESPLSIHLGQAISRGEKMDFAIQKGVELGVRAITPLITQHCALKITDSQLHKKMSHWHGIVISACEQSGRAVLPQLYPPISLTNWLTQVPHAYGIVADPEANQSIASLSARPSQISLLIGPEGGLHTSEIILAQQNQFHTIKLGQRILRTETAALAAISVIQSRWGDF